MLLLRGAKIYTCGPQGTLLGSILIKGTKILAVAERLDPPDGADVLDVKGKIITPGFIDAHSHLGTAIYGEQDSCETSQVATPHLHILDSFDPMDLSIADALTGGITTVMLHPGGPQSFGKIVENINIIPGQSAVIKTVLQGAKPQVLKEYAGVKMAFGEHPKRVFSEKATGPHTRMKVIAVIREYLYEARKWLNEQATKNENGVNRVKSLKYGALAQVLQGKLKAHIHVHKIRDIQAALNLADEFNISIVLEHATEADQLAEELASRQISCVLGPIAFSRRGTELANISLQTPARLAEAGVKFALMTDHPTYPSHQLPLFAGMAVREGLDYEQALLAITRYAAEIIGVGDRVGSLEEGKDADLVVHDGDPLDVTGKICGVMCNGQWLRGYRDQGILYDWTTGRECK